MIPGIGNRGVHLLGICGTGMAALAGMLKERGYRITGSDQHVYPPMSDMLAGLGIPVRSPYGPENVPEAVDLVVVGNAISRGNPELETVLDRDLPYASMPEVVKELFLRGRTSVVVAGTHGKTTTTGLLSWVLENSGKEPGFLVGGVPINFGVSYRVGCGNPFVIEGDEYDTAYFDKGPKFLHYLPRLVVLNNIEYDHADIYPDLDSVATAFRRLVNLVPRTGLLVVGVDSRLAKEVAASTPCPVESFALQTRATWTLGRVEPGPDGPRFEVLREGKRFLEFHGPFWGEAAQRNVLAVVAAAHRLGLDREQIAAGLASFEGVRRRLEVRGEAQDILVVDDFAHHPTAVYQTLRAARLRWPDRRIWAVFEPRSFTARSNVFQDEFVTALGAADRVVVAEVYSSRRLPADRELSEERVTDELVRRGVDARFIPNVEDIVRFLIRELSPKDVVVGMSNGGFGGLHRRLLDALALRGEG